MMRRSIQAAVLAVTCVTAVAATAVAAPAGDDTDYVIKLDRPMTVGRQFEFQGECMLVQSTSGTIMGSARPEQSSRYVLRLESTLEIKGVDDHGRPTETAHVIRECAITKDGVVFRTYDAGALLTAQRTDKDSDNDIRIDGSPVLDETRGLFDVLSCLDHDGATEDELYGSGETRRVGDSWSIDLDAALADFQRQTSMPLKKDQLTGTVTLLSDADHGGEPCLTVYTEMALQDGILGLTEMPPGSRLEEASTSMKFQGIYPKDETRTWRSRSAQIDFHLVMVQAGSGTLHSDTSVVANLNIAPVRAADMATVTPGPDTAAPGGR